MVSVSSCTLWTLLTVHTIVIVIHAYDASLRASKEKEQQLQSQLATVQQESQQQLLKLKDENYDLHNENKQQQEELKRLQQKGKMHTYTQEPIMASLWAPDIVHTCTWCVVTADVDEVRLTAIKKEQQRLLQVVEQWQRMGRARDVQISQLQNENELVQDKCKN